MMLAASRFPLPVRLNEIRVVYHPSLSIATYSGLGLGLEHGHKQWLSIPDACIIICTCHGQGELMADNCNTFPEPERHYPRHSVDAQWHKGLWWCKSRTRRTVVSHSLNSGSNIVLLLQLLLKIHLIAPTKKSQISENRYLKWIIMNEGRSSSLVWSW